MASAPFPSSNESEPVYLIVKLSCLRNQKPPYTIVSITPKGQQPPPNPTNKLFQNYTDIPITRVGSTIEEEFILKLQRSIGDSIEVIQSFYNDYASAEAFTAKELELVIKDAKSEAKSVERATWMYDKEMNLKSAGVRIGGKDGNYHWWDIMEVNLLSGQGYGYEGGKATRGHDWKKDPECTDLGRYEGDASGYELD